ncbi:toll/interleukin-1 receptor domain-containing protein [[Clostridium] innocuum]|nr:toll/interleukin-1 receptor domain-containing protein [[Clostridium] innocuum]MCR0576784.1 toll/interleukin-1 receptor domain-containing protein [[Clostridium] innocuum]
MKIFVSWSGELSCQIAEILKKWIPCLLQSVEVFFSPEDIEKGDNWDKTISNELSECKYGIICLTTENTTAPWINFEAGAIAKSLDSRVTALMVNIKPSDIKGPLSRYQATKFEKTDFFQLVSSINKVLDTPLDHAVLENTFNAMWGSLENEAIKLIGEYSSKNEVTKPQNNSTSKNEALEEVLQLLRQQSALLSNPEKLLPIDYMDFMLRKMNERNRDLSSDYEMMTEELLHYVDTVLENIGALPNHSITNDVLHILKFEDLLQIIMHNIRRKGNKRIYVKTRQLEQKYQEVAYGRRENLNNVLINKKMVTE